MIEIGNFFFRYRNTLFIFLYALLFFPSPELFTEKALGEHYWYFPLYGGLLITVLGQAVRGATIGLAYIVRGGKDKKVYAEDLVSTGIFAHCRNPLYVGNILMLLGVGILSNSAYYVLIVMPLFLFIYQAIVLAEENFLRSKFGLKFDEYCATVNRWVPSLRGLSTTFSSMKFNWRRWVLKEYNTQFVWLTGIALLLLFEYPQIVQSDSEHRNQLLTIVLPFLAVGYIVVRYLKKSGKFTE